MVNAPCPCGSSIKYKRCCQAWHKGGEPPTAEALMRSRYAAYAVGDARYVMRTTHPQCPEWQPEPTRWAASIAEFCRTTTFVKLDVLASQSSLERATVTFCATLRRGNDDVSFSETSQFVCEEGRWRYRAGQRI